MILLAGTLLGTTALSGCDIDPDAVVMTVDDAEVSLGFANFVVKYNQAELDYYYTYYFGEDVWSQESYTVDGETMGQVQKDEAIDQIQTWYLLEAVKDDYDVSVSDEEMEEITAAAEEFMSANEEEGLDQMGATQEYVEQMLYFYLLETKMEYAIGEEAEITVTDEDAAMRTFTYITFTVTDDEEDEESEEDTEDTEEEEDEDVLTLEQVEAYAEMAQEDFDSVYEIMEDSDYGYVGSYSYAADESDIEDVVVEAADALSEGEISELVEGESSYYLLRLDSEYDEEASEEYKEELIQEQKDDYYAEVVADLEDSASISLKRLQWRKVVLRDIFDVVSGDDEDTEDTEDTTEDTEGTEDTEDTSEEDDTSQTDETETSEDTGETEDTSAEEE